VLSRRAWVVRLSTVLGAVGVARVARAEQITQEAAHYQDCPNNLRTCGMCRSYIPPGGKAGGMMPAGTCELVEGRISPMGWCVLYWPHDRS